MTVASLIKKLSKCDPRAEIIMSSDMEGNSYGQFGSVYNPKGLRYRRSPCETEWGLKGEIELTDDEDDQFPGKPCVILYPDM